MKKVTLKINDTYKSIPSGFIWTDIPQFAIITGVNGVGKSQLLEILNRKDKNNMAIYCEYDIKNEDGEDYNFILSSPEIEQLNIQGLLTYHSEYNQRITNIEQWNNAIKDWNDRINWLNYNLKNNVLDKDDARRQTQECQELHNNIRSYKQMINNAIIFAYEKELQQVSIKVGKNISDLTEIDIRKFANPYFYTFTEIDDFQRFIKQEHDDYKDKLAILATKSNFAEIENLSKEEQPYQTINRLFRKYGFSYFEMLDPFPEYKERNGEIKFKGQLGEIIDYNALSSGEQMIVKFIIWSLGRDISGARINTMILDEPDAHLHPTMSKMMVDILYEISESKTIGGGDIRVILTTHSPSTVAFAPIDSLFVMEKDEKNNRIIKPTTTQEAVRILSDGIFTFEKAIGKFTIATNSSKNNLLFVEGKTDINHLKKAIKILGYDLDLDIIDMHDAGALSNFIRSTPIKLCNSKKLIALFDCDDEGRNCLKSIHGDTSSIPNVKKITAVQCENKSFALCIQAPAELERYCPIEFLYPYDYLKSKDILEERNYKEYKNLFKADSPDEDAKITAEFKNKISLRPYKVLDNKKNSFSENIKKETDPKLFENFKPTIELIIKIIAYKE